MASAEIISLAAARAEAAATALRGSPMDQAAFQRARERELLATGRLAIIRGLLVDWYEKIADAPPEVANDLNLFGQFVFEEGFRAGYAAAASVSGARTKNPCPPYTDLLPPDLMEWADTLAILGTDHARPDSGEGLS